VDATGPNERLLGQTDQAKEKAPLSVTVDAVVRKVNLFNPIRFTMLLPSDINLTDGGVDWS
jgi:hypothetical protein